MAQKPSNTIDLPFDTLQQAYDSATEAEEWFTALYVSEANGKYRLTDFKPDGKIHLTLINDKINLITAQSKELK